MRIDEIMKEMEAFQRKIIESMFEGFTYPELFNGFETREGQRLFNDVDKIVKGLENEEPKGEWRIERIDEPGVKGFIARGYFSSSNPLKKPEEILPPLRPQPGEPRKPLYDVHAEEDFLRLYVELPGVEKDQIKLNIAEGKLILEAKAFREEIDLSRWVVNPEGMIWKYRNGVLEVSIPKEDLEEQMI